MRQQIQLWKSPWRSNGPRNPHSSTTGYIGPTLREHGPFRTPKDGLLFLVTGKRTWIYSSFINILICQIQFKDSKKKLHSVLP